MNKNERTHTLILACFCGTATMVAHSELISLMFLILTIYLFTLFNRQEIKINK